MKNNLIPTININPLIKKAIKRRVEFDSIDSIFRNYRKKEIFSKIRNECLYEYINSKRFSGVTSFNNFSFISFLKFWKNSSTL